MDPDELELQLKARARLRLQQQAATPGVGEDVVRSLPAGVYHGVTGLATLPGNADDLARHVGHWLAEKIAGKPLPLPARLAGPDKLGKITGGAILPTATDLEDRLKTGALNVPKVNPYEAKTRFGKVTEGLTSLAVGASAMPAKSAVDVGMNLLKYDAAPYVASQGAGYAADVAGAGPEAKALAETAAAAATGGVAAKVSKPAMVAPTNEENAAASRVEYKAARDLDMAVTPTATQGLVSRIERLHDERVADPDTDPKSIRQLDRIKDLAAKGPMTINEMEKRRQVLGKIERDNMTPDGNPTSDANLAGDMIDEIDDHLTDLTPADVTGGGNPQDMVAHLQEARRLFRLRRNGELIQNAFFRAENSGQAARGNMDDALRTQFRAIANNPKRFGRFDPDTKAAILEVVRADKPERALRFLSRFSPEQHPWSSAFGAGLGAAALGPLGAIGLPIAGALGGAAASARTLRQAELAGGLARGGFQPPNIAVKRLPMLVPGFYNMATQGPGGP